MYLAQLPNFVVSFQVLRRELSDYGVSKISHTVSSLKSKLRALGAGFDRENCRDACAVLQNKKFCYFEYVDVEIYIYI